MDDMMLPPVTMDALLEDKMQQLIYMMAQGMKYNLPSLDLTDETNPFYL